MSPHSLPCPWCATPLRVKDRALVGRVFSCPDCRARIQVVEDGSDGLSIRRAGLSAANDAPAKARSASRSSTASGPRKEPASQLEHGFTARLNAGKRLLSSIGAGIAHGIGMLRDPLVLSWTVAGVFTLVMLCVIQPWGRGEPAVADAVRSAPKKPSQEAASQEPAKVPRPTDEAPPPVGAVLLPPEVAETAPVTPSLVEEHESRPAIVAARPRLSIIAAQPVNMAIETSPATSAKPQQVDVAALLEQPIRRYELTKAVPLAELLPELKELAAVPIHADAAANPGLADRLARPVTLRLEDTTVGEILRAFVKQVGLELDVRPDGVHLRVKPQDAPLSEK